MTRPNKDILLAIDTSTRTAGLALYDGSVVLVESTWTSLDHHTIELAPAISEAFNKSGVLYSDLTAVAVAQGPGSFTGLRISFALAKGLALAQHIPLIAIPTLDILAAAQPVLDIPMMALLRAGRGRFAAASYVLTRNRWISEGQLDVLTSDDITHRIKTETYICGELSSEERELFTRACPMATLATPAHSLRRTAFLAELAWRQLRTGKVDDPAKVVPIYLHYNQPIPA